MHLYYHLLAIKFCGIVVGYSISPYIIIVLAVADIAPPLLAWFLFRLPFHVKYHSGLKACDCSSLLVCTTKYICLWSSQNTCGH